MPKHKKKLDKKTSSRLRRKRFFVGLMVAGLVVIVGAITHRWFYERALRINEELVGDYQIDQGKVVPVRLKIWDMIDVPVRIVPFINGQWVVAETGASYLGQSAGIGRPGNMIVYGHNKRDGLGEMRVFKGGERFRVWGSDGKEYWYQVTKVVTTNPDEMKWLESGTTHELTMYTCTGFMDSKRFIVKAKLVDEK